MATYLKTNGEQKEVHPANPEEGFTLEELYTFTNGGPVERLVLLRGQELWMNEEARLTSLPFNSEASLRASREILGDVLLAQRGEVK
jgi:hypothetical protein